MIADGDELANTTNTSTRTTAAIARTHTVAIAGTSQRFFFFAAGGPGCAEDGGGAIEGGGPTGTPAGEEGAGVGAGEGVALSAAFTAVPQWGQKAPEAYRRFRTGFNVVLLSEGELARRIKRKDSFVTTAMAEAVGIEVGGEW